VTDKERLGAAEALIKQVSAELSGAFMSKQLRDAIDAFLGRRPGPPPRPRAKVVRRGGDFNEPAGRA
jgi:hypothetical protein